MCSLINQMEQHYYLISDSQFRVLQESFDRAIRYCETATSTGHVIDDTQCTYAEATGYSEGAMRGARIILDSCAKQTTSY